MLLPNPELLIHTPVGGEWIIIILVVIVFFGGKKIPELARGLGRGIREFNDAKDGIKREIEHGIKDDDSDDQHPSIPTSSPTEIQEEK